MISLIMPAFALIPRLWLGVEYHLKRNDEFIFAGIYFREFLES